MNSNKVTPISDEMAAWEAELADGGKADQPIRVPTPEQEEKHEGGCCAPAPKQAPMPPGAE